MMRTDIAGRLRNFPLSVEKPLMPVFEAITNSLQSIDKIKPKNSQISVRIIRDTSTPSLFESTKFLPPVIGFIIEDNGVGFTDANFDSFLKSDSTYKLKIGGKGVGRFSWLKVFEHAEVTSVFKSGNSFSRREFNFTVEDVNWDEILHDVNDTQVQKTIVKLCNIRHEYQKHCPKNASTIARKIIEHFLSHVSIQRKPSIVLIDEYDGSIYDLVDEFNNNIKIHFERQKTTIGSYKFTLGHFRLRVGGSDPCHEIHFCARNRSAESHNLKKQNSIFDNVLYDNDGQFVYSCYVSSDFFDERVDQARTRLELVNSNDELLSKEEPSREVILAKVAEHAERYLESFLTPIKTKNTNRVTEYIQNHPKYRPILGSRPQWIERIKSGLTDDELNIELFRLLQKLESENFQEGQQLKKSRIEQKTTESLEEHKRRFDKFLEETNAIGFSKLAEYIIHRRAVINFINDCKKQLPDGRYEYEKAIHNVVFPMGKTSNTIQNAEQSNLWLLDDRLSYHYHLASDIQNSQLEKIEISEDSQDDRMDLVVLQTFDRPHAFVGTSDQPFHAVTIVEFKRPMRDDYVPADEKKDPILQVWGYANSIREGYAKDKKGEFIRVSSGTQFYVYLVCDITKKITDLALQHQLQDTPDGLGFFGWHQNYKLYTEVIDYKKLIQDAEKRNSIFFDKLGISAID